METRSFAAFLVLGVTVLSGCKNEVEDAVRHDLIDADSAQFRDVKRCSGDTNISRGEVNAKNRMGAYVGFEPFFYDGVSVAFAGNEAFQSMMNRCYSNPKTGFDATSNTTAPTAPEPAATQWITRDDVNPVDDSKTRVATLIAEEGASSRNDAVSLIIRCRSKKTELYVNWHDYLGDDSNDVYEDWKNVTVRVGREKAQTQRWTISTDNEATFAPGSSINLIKQMLRADRLVLQTTPYNENPITAVFVLKGMKEAVAPIAQECGWKL